MIRREPRNISKTEGSIDRMLCSKIRVKSNFLVELAGPKSLSLAKPPRTVSFDARVEAIDQ